MTVLLMEAAVVFLMATTCVYCFFLNRKLNALKQGQHDLKAAILVFDEATQRAQQSLEKLEKSGLTHPEDLDGKLRKASELAAELSVMIGAGDNIASRIETTIADVRTIGKIPERGARIKSVAKAQLGRCA